MHLGDYKTARNEVEVFCSEHLPDTDVSIFTTLEDDVYDDIPYIPTTILHHKGFRMGIRYLTENARSHADMNEPNIGSDFDIEVKK